MFDHQSIPAEAMTAFCFSPPSSSANAWCMFKDGAVHGTPDRSKRSLLIGYDLMPLRGLRQTCKWLESKGIFAKRCEISTSNASPLLAVTLHGKLQVDSCFWSTFYEQEGTDSSFRQVAGASFKSACSWLAREIESKRLEEARVLSEWSWTLSDYKNDRWTVADGRRRTTTLRLIAKCAEIFQKLDYRIVPVTVSAK